MKEALKRKWKQNNGAVKTGRFIGAHVPKNVWELLTLHAVAHQLPKTELIRSIMLEWFQTQQRDGTRGLVQTIVTRLQAHWYRHKTMKLIGIDGEKRVQAFEEWWVKQVEELTRQGISEKIIETLKNRIRQ